MTRFGSWLALPFLLACGSSPQSDTPQPTSGGAEPTTGDASTGVDPTGVDPSATPCEQSEDCEDSGICAATYDAGLRVPGPAFCVESCVEPGDLARWCVDDSSCCAGAACSQVDGFCVPPDPTGTSSSGGAMGTSTGSSSSGGGDSTGDTTDSAGSSTTGPSTGGAAERRPSAL